MSGIYNRQHNPDRQILCDRAHGAAKCTYVLYRRSLRGDHTLHIPSASAYPAYARIPNMSKVTKAHGIHPTKRFDVSSFLLHDFRTKLRLHSAYIHMWKPTGVELRIVMS